MPQSHREFLFHVLSIANIRDFVMNENCPEHICKAYQAAVLSLTSFRNKHIQIVARYIVAPSKRASELHSGEPLNIATASLGVAGSDKSGLSKLCGTGGTMLMPFLKQTREETRMAADIQ